MISHTLQGKPSSQRLQIHPLAIRLMHWTNALATLVMMTSGWQIYNASPILTFRFSSWMTLGGWLGGALLWHFAAMWLLTVNALCYLGYGVISRRFKNKLLPLSLRELTRDLYNAARGRLGHADLSHYNAVQKFSYVGVLSALVLVVASGLAIWKPVQLYYLSQLFGGFQGSRIVHFVAMSVIAVFLVVHVGMSLLVPKSLRTMVRGN
jgi:thiosulfate reductase cytochrome b subunit